MWMFAMKPARLQVSYGAYPMSAGLSAIDYRITDPHVDPPGESDQYSVEKLLRNRQLLVLSGRWRFTGGRRASRPAQTVQSLRLDEKPRQGVAAGAIKIWTACLSPRSPVPNCSCCVNDAAGRAIFLQQFARHGIDPQRVQNGSAAVAGWQ